MKVYLHLEGEHSFTLALNVSERTSISDVLAEFAAAFKASAQGLRLSTVQATLKDVDGKTIRDVRKTLHDQLSAGDDLFIVDGTVDAADEDATADDVLVDDVDELTLDENASPSKSSKAKAKAKAKARAKAKATVVVAPATFTAEQKNELGKLLLAKSFKRAREVAEGVLRDVSSTDEYALRALGEVFYNSKNYTKAIEICKVALRTMPASLQVHYNLARSLMATKNFTEATEIVKAMIRNQTKPASSLLSEPASMRTEAFKMELVAMHAECLFALGQHNDAVALINDVTANPASAASTPILIAYSSFAMQYNKFEEPTRALLKAVIMGENPRVRELMARLMSTEAGMNEILKQVPPSAKPSDADSKGKAEVYAFLGYVAKCHSVVKASLRFYHLALQMQSANASYALNLVHMYEIAADYDGAMQIAQDFFRANPQLGLGVAKSSSSSSSSHSVLRCRDMLALLECDPTQTYSRAAVPAFSWVALEASYGYVQFHAQAAEPGGECGEDGPSPTPGAVKVRYTDPELDLLALFATVVKVLFLQGKLHLLPGLYRVLEPCRMQSEKGLHETSIRNEMAYLQEIAQLLCYRSAHASYGLAELGSTAVSRAGLYNVFPLLAINRGAAKSPVARAAVSPTAAGSSSSSSSSSSRCVPSSSSASELPPLLRDAALRPIYVLGDSHSVSPAWSVVRVRGEPRLLVPRLATGVKHWHLRSDSTFYPRAHFLNMVASIPAGSEVILNVGEIDCREGILLSVERDYYSGFDEAVKHTLGVFLPVLRDLVSKNRLKVYVHPIPPVLDVTRAMVIRYNAFYKNAIAGIRGVYWLDIFDDLIDTRETGNVSDPVETKLKPEFALDGTHLNPSYLRLLEGSLAKIAKMAK